MDVDAQRVGYRLPLFFDATGRRIEPRRTGSSHEKLHAQPGERMVAAAQPGSVAVVASSLKTFLLVETGSIKDPFQEINDEQLLALAGGRPVALVRQGPHQAELLFLNPEDTNGFPVQ